MIQCWLSSRWNSSRAKPNSSKVAKRRTHKSVLLERPDEPFDGAVAPPSWWMRPTSISPSTVPAELRAVLCANQRDGYALLMKAAAGAIIELARDPRWVQRLPGCDGLLPTRRTGAFRFAFLLSALPGPDPA